MVSMLSSSAVDREFESRSSRTKDYEIGICCFSAKHAAPHDIAELVLNNNHSLHIPQTLFVGYNKINI